MAAKTMTAVRAGISRGLIEFRNSLTTPSDLLYYLFGAGILLTVLLLNRDNLIDELGMSVSVLLFPSVLAMQLVFVASFGLATLVATEREDGTLLRAKSIPGGMSGYVVGQSVRTAAEVLFSVGLCVVVATPLVAGLWERGALGMLHAGAILLLGMLAMLPFGFIIASVFKNPRSIGGWGFLAMAALIAISGLFFPLQELPLWTQIIGQVLPLYWLGLAMRQAILPDAASVLEIDQSWRTLEALGVLGLWALAGLLLAPVLLRRMARRESGSSMEQRRQKAMQRV